MARLAALIAAAMLALVSAPTAHAYNGHAVLLAALSSSTSPLSYACAQLNAKPYPGKAVILTGWMAKTHLLSGDEARVAMTVTVMAHCPQNIRILTGDPTVIGWADQFGGGGDAAILAAYNDRGRSCGAPISSLSAAITMIAHCR